MHWDAQRCRIYVASSVRRGASWFWARTSTGGVVFGTLLREVVEAPSVVAGLDVAQLLGQAEAIPDLFATGYLGVQRIPRGFTLTVDPTRLVPLPAARPWFRLEPQAVRHYPDATSEANAVRSALDEAVAVGLAGSGEIGCFMSGGLDSTTVAVLAARHIDPARVRAWCHIPLAGTPDVTPTMQASDQPWASAVAAAEPGIDLELVTTPLDPTVTEVLQRFISATATAPLVPSNEAWLMDLYAHARDSGLQYLLNGVGGNLSFSMGLRHPSALLVNGEYLAAWRWHTDRGARLAGSIKSLTSAWTTRREERNWIDAFLTPEAAELVQPQREESAMNPAAPFRLRRRDWLHRIATVPDGHWGALIPDVWKDDPYTDPEFLRGGTARPRLRMG